MRRSLQLAIGAAALAGAALGTAVVRGHRARARRRRVLDRSLSAAACEARHAAKVARVRAQLRAHPPGTPLSLRKKSPPHQVPKFGDLRRHDEKVDISELDDIISIDPIARICTAESGATFEDVVAATLRYGLVPIVVPELKTITVGGAVTGCSIESMSFRYGGFHDTCVAYEVITAKGEVLACTADNANALVFQMIHGSFGTLGILAKLSFRLVPAKPFVHVTYEHHHSIEAYTAAIERHTKSDLDFIDGILHSATDCVLALGRFVDTAPYANKYDWMKIYYLSTATRTEDYLRTTDYLFRYDRGVTSVHPKSLVGRMLFGKLMDSGTTLRLADKLHKYVLQKDRPTITLDVFLPFSKVPEFLAWYRETFKFFPLWMVPYRRIHDYEWLADSFYRDMQDELFLDLAIYGMEQPPDANYHKLMEAKLQELGGVKTLISHNYYTPEQFWQTWNKRNYDQVKQITDPDNLFRDLYTKTCKIAMGQPETERETARSASAGAPAA